MSSTKWSLFCLALNVLIYALVGDRVSNATDQRFSAFPIINSLTKTPTSADDFICFLQRKFWYLNTIVTEFYSQ